MPALNKGQPTYLLLLSVRYSGEQPVLLQELDLSLQVRPRMHTHTHKHTERDTNTARDMRHVHKHVPCHEKAGGFCNAILVHTVAHAPVCSCNTDTHTHATTGSVARLQVGLECTAPSVLCVYCRVGTTAPKCYGSLPYSSRTSCSLTARSTWPGLLHRDRHTWQR